MSKAEELSQSGPAFGPGDTSASPLFAKMYQSLLIDSHELMITILKRERCFMAEFGELIAERDRFMRQLLESDAETVKLEKSKWKLRVDALRSEQQRKFRKFIAKLYESKENEQLGRGIEGLDEKVREIEKDLELNGHDIHTKPSIDLGTLIFFHFRPK